MEADDRDAVWAAVGAIYDGFLAGDRAAIDANIAPDATMWDAFHAPLVRGKAELDAVRDARPSGGPRPSELRAVDPVIDVFGDFALIRHVLVVVTPDEPDRRVRNTSVWRRDAGGPGCASTSTKTCSRKIAACSTTRNGSAACPSGSSRRASTRSSSRRQRTSST